MIRANELVGEVDVVLVTLDTLRFDVAAECLLQGRTPALAGVLPQGRWEARHTPGSFTYAAHQAFFTGFLPTPVAPGPHPRLFAADFPGSETTAPETFTFAAPTLVEGLRDAGYHTLCIGGVGFFNQQTELGRILPRLFDESHWSPEMGVTSPHSTERQVALACRRLREIPHDRRLFLFLNVSAIHQPNRLFMPGAVEDSCESMAAALAYVDHCLATLFRAIRNRRGALCVICSDHGTAYGEDGYRGHRMGHPVVWTVPYAEFVLSGAPE